MVLRVADGVLGLESGSGCLLVCMQYLLIPIQASVCLYLGVYLDPGLDAGVCGSGLWHLLVQAVVGLCPGVCQFEYGYLSGLLWI